MNRFEQPEVKTISHIEFIKPLVFDITPDIPLIWMKEVPNETVRLDLYFDAGIIRGENSIPAIVHSLLFSGTADKTSTEIHEEIDALGGFLDTDISMETAVVTIYCLREHLDTISKLVTSALSGMSFRENEVDDVMKTMSQRFHENKLKVKTVAQQGFREALFGSQTTYSNVAKAEDFEISDVLTMKRFFRDHYLNGLTRVTIVGNIEQDEIDALIDRFGQWSMDGKPAYEGFFEPEAGEVHLPVESTVQTAVRIGRMMFRKSHPDYIEFQILNTILGDYFGSRLMSNIREDKGYTYGIGSAMMELHENGYFVIVTEVGSDVTALTLKEIRFEMDRLRTEPVSSEELELVRNYMLGQLLKSADGPYAMLDMFNSVDMYGLDLSFYDDAIRKLHEITPERIMELANKYLDWKDFLIVTAG